MIYLDHAATTPVPRAVADAMYAVLTEQFGNPSAQYAMGLHMKNQVSVWRETVARALDCPPGQLHFTSCGTEGDNWAIQAALWQNRHLGRHVVTTAVEHSAVGQACAWMEKQGCEVSYVSPEADGGISAEKILSAVRPDTALVSVMLVNNELGSVYPVSEIARGLQEKNPKTLLHTDAVQGFLKVNCSARALGADFVTVSAHKIGGPKGIGALYISPRVRNPRPLLPGGGQEGGLRSGTEATAQIAGFAKAVELRTENLAQKLAHMAAIKAYAVEQLCAIDDLTIIGSGTAPHILAVSLVGWPSQNIVNDLSEQGICISAGSACHQGKPSHVVAALKLPKRTAGGVIRLSFGPETTQADIDACAAALRRHHDTRLPML
ncbi:cysteine desulfurase family protein [Oscillibacter sp.]|uniref:cysteine desulfurase family protein n=1 Tax=Oscillibacter sp. TaxID=1945593 RepID=UPI00262D2123|nr:cysteine desulfurase family protein [Oscillibacter sp.]MDD3346994.1 cysteine desulfurase family protein [Oscillibacter sp.]